MLIKISDARLLIRCKKELLHNKQKFVMDFDYCYNFCTDNKTCVDKFVEMCKI